MVQFGSQVGGGGGCREVGRAHNLGAPGRCSTRCGGLATW